MNDGIETLRIAHARLDAAAAPGFRDEVGAQFADGTPRRLVIDMREVDFVDSTGLGVLVALVKRMDPGSRIAVLGANSAVRRLFQITRLDTLFVLCNDDAEVAAALG